MDEESEGLGRRKKKVRVEEKEFLARRLREVESKDGWRPRMRKLPQCLTENH